MEFTLKEAVYIVQVFLIVLLSGNACARNNNPNSDFEISDYRSVTKGVQNTKCGRFQAYGYPVVKDNSTIKRSYYTCRLGYAAQFDPIEKTSLWVAEYISAANTKGSASRDEIDFIQDPDIPINLTGTDRDYSRSGFQRGHLAPAGDNKHSQVSMNETFFYSNAVPQTPQNNMHIWNYLEGATREIANRRGELYVLTGPIFKSIPRKKIKNNISVPDYLYKVLIDKRSKSMTAFIIPNRDDTGDDFTKFQVSVREVEKATGINFNPELSRQEADMLEVSGGDWVMPKTRRRNLGS